MAIEIWTAVNPPDAAALRTGKLGGQRAAGAIDARTGLAQHVGRGRVGDPEMRREAKRGAVHHRHARHLQQIADEILVVLYRLAGRRSLAYDAGAGRIDVERALGPRTEQARHPVQHIDDEVAPLLEAAIMDRNEILRPGER